MTKLFVGNIPHAAAEADLQEWVESLGFPVESAEIIRDRSTGMPRGFGFVLLREQSQVKQAIQLLNGDLVRVVCPLHPGQVVVSRIARDFEPGRFSAGRANHAGARR